jgi:RimJ/RimL family protein N-acetyltransferase
LRLFAATAGLIADDLAGQKQLATSLKMQVPDNWPPELYDRNALDFAANQLQNPDENGWSFWYLADRQGQPESLLGICGFKGRPGESGQVEIGYSILSQYRNQGFATEAVSRLVDWAFGHANVQDVRAETLPHLKQSIRVLEKNGFAFAGQGSEQGVISYSISRSDLN